MYPYFLAISSEKGLLVWCVSFQYFLSFSYLESIFVHTRTVCRTHTERDTQQIEETILYNVAERNINCIIFKVLHSKLYRRITVCVICFQIQGKNLLYVCFRSVAVSFAWHSRAIRFISRFSSHFKLANIHKIDIVHYLTHWNYHIKVKWTWPYSSVIIISSKSMS